MSLLFFCTIDFDLYYKILKKRKAEYLVKRLRSIVSGFKDYNYINLTPRQLKLKKQGVLNKLKMLR